MMDIPRSRIFLFIAFLLTFTFACSSLSSSVTAGPLTAQVTEVFFFPRGGATEAVVRELGSAKQEIVVQAYIFTFPPIAKAQVDSHKRRVKVAIVLDRRSTGSSRITTSRGITKRLGT
jgi:phosphatidylserine/phosphatidylglycerophosphate/cardiolipin synthase-like enzyme